MASKKLNTAKFWELIQNHGQISIYDWRNTIEQIPFWCDSDIENRENDYPAHSAAVDWLLKCEIGRIASPITRDILCAANGQTVNVPELFNMAAAIVHNKPVLLLALANFARFANKEEARAKEFEKAAEEVFFADDVSAKSALKECCKDLEKLETSKSKNAVSEVITLTKTAIFIDCLDQRENREFLKPFPAQSLVDKITANVERILSSKKA